MHDSVQVDKILLPLELVRKVSNPDDPDHRGAMEQLRERIAAAPPGVSISLDHERSHFEQQRSCQGYEFINGHYCYPSIQGVPDAAAPVEADWQLWLTRAALDGVVTAPLIHLLSRTLSSLSTSVRSINFSHHHQVLVDSDDEPCFLQRKEWVEWILEECRAADEVVNSAKECGADKKFRSAIERLRKPVRGDRDYGALLWNSVLDEIASAFCPQASCSADHSVADDVPSV